MEQTVLNEKILDLIKKYRQAETKSVEQSEDEKLEVGWGIAGLTFVYEKFRNLMDFRDEHVIRRRAIERIFRRRIQYIKNPDDIALPLIQELIWARYVKEPIYKNKVAEVSQIIRRYLWLLEGISTLDKKRVRRLKSYLFEVAACELEGALIPQSKELALLEAMVAYAQQKLDLSEWKISESQKEIQLFVSCQKELFGNDHATVVYRLLRKLYPQWSQLSLSDIPLIAPKLYDLFSLIESQIQGHLAQRLSAHLRKIAVLFRFLHESISENLDSAEERILHRGSLDDSIRRHYFQKDSLIRGKLRRAVFRSTIYIFLTKAALAFAVEFPYDLFLARHQGFQGIAVNILFPPLLMFLVASTVRVPNALNVEKVIEGVFEIVDGNVREKIKVAPPARRKGWQLTSYTVAYLITFVISFGLLAWGLWWLEFSIVSGFVFVFFLCLVSFFGYRTRRMARELMVLPRKVTILSVIGDFLSLPVLRAGQWLVQKSAKVNIFVYFMDFIVEAPFKMLVEIVEDLSKFFREKKEELT